MLVFSEDHEEDDRDTVPFVENHEPAQSNRDGHLDLDKDPPKKKRRPLWTQPAFLVFVVASVSCAICAVLYFMDPDTGYIVSGTIGLAACVYGIRYFPTVLGLKKEIDEFGALNKEFRRNRFQLDKELNRITAAKDNLVITQQRITVANEKNLQNLGEFRKYQDVMHSLNAESVKDLNQIVNQSKAIESRWHEELYSHQRNMLHTVFDRFCMESETIAMDKRGFDQFTEQLPVTYQQRFTRIGTFEKLAGKKNVILLEDFERCLDIFAEMHADDVDIEIELQPTTHKRAESPSITLLRKRTTHAQLGAKERKQLLAEIYEQEEPSSPLMLLSPDNVRQQPKLSLFPSVKEDQDTGYDEDLIMYQQQIVITRRRFVLPPATPVSPLAYGLNRQSSVARSVVQHPDPLIKDISHLSDLGHMTSADIDAADFSEQQMNAMLAKFKPD